MKLADAVEYALNNNCVIYMTTPYLFYERNAFVRINNQKKFESMTDQLELCFFTKVHPEFRHSLFSPDRRKHFTMTCGPINRSTPFVPRIKDLVGDDWAVFTATFLIK